MAIKNLAVLIKKYNKFVKTGDFEMSDLDMHVIFSMP